MALTFTLAGHNFNDGSSYVLDADTLEIDQLTVTTNEIATYIDGSTVQTAVVTKGAASVRFTLLIEGTTAALVDTAFDNLVSWVLAGGTLIVSDGATSVLNCTVGVSQPPTRTITNAYLLNHHCTADVELRRLT